MTVRFGQVGLGYHGLGAALPSFFHPDTKGVELVAVCDASQERLDKVDKPVAKYRSLEELLAGSDVDAIYMAAGMDRHCALALTALKAGKHVVCEKPMAANADECLKMVKAAEAAGRLLVVNFETRYNQKNAILKRWLGGGYLGEVGAIHFTNMWDCHKSYSASKDRRAHLLSLAGALDCGIHKLDQARYLLGGKWATVDAVGAWLGEPCAPPPHIGIIGTLDNGLMVTLNASLAWAANIPPRPMLDSVYIAGTEGVVIVNTDLATSHTVAEIHSRKMSEKIEFSDTGHTNDMALMLSEVAAYIEGGLQGPHIFATGEDGYQAQLATEKANAAAQAKRIR